MRQRKEIRLRCHHVYIYNFFFILLIILMVALPKSWAICLWKNAAKALRATAVLPRKAWKSLWRPWSANPRKEKTSAGLKNPTGDYVPSSQFERMRSGRRASMALPAAPRSFVLIRIPDSPAAMETIARIVCWKKRVRNWKVSPQLQIPWKVESVGNNKNVNIPWKKGGKNYPRNSNKNKELPRKSPWTP